MSPRASTRPSPSCPWSMEVHMATKPYGLNKHTPLGPLTSFKTHPSKVVERKRTLHQNYTI